MMIEQAIKHLDRLIGNQENADNIALRMAVQALRAQQEREKPEPLTVEELDKMKDVPIWVKEIEKHWQDGWCVWNGCEALIPNCRSWWYDYNDYGKTWLAYRSRPEEEIQDDD